MVSSSEATSIRNNADFLINIDNTNMTQVPSKLFEYISTGKPIINFYFNDKSPSLVYLQRYPLCLNIKVTCDPIYAAKMIESFIVGSLNRMVPIEVIAKRFAECTPEYVANLFSIILNNQ